MLMIRIIILMIKIIIKDEEYDYKDMEDIIILKSLPVIMKMMIMKISD